MTATPVRRTRWARSTMAAALATMLAGCGGGLEALPLPAPGHVNAPITIVAAFANAMNLPAKAKVKLNGADIGEVESIRAKDFTAYVTMRIESSVPLYTDATAELRSATPLGDIFVAIRQKPVPGQGERRLHNDDSIALSATTSASTVEDVLTSAALLVNGGAIRRLVTVVNGAGHALGGRGAKLADLLHESNTLVSRLNTRSAQIDDALRSTSDLAATLASRQTTLEDGISASVPALAVIDDSITTLTDLASGLGRITKQLTRFHRLRFTLGSVTMPLNSAASAFRSAIMLRVSVPCMDGNRVSCLVIRPRPEARSVSVVMLSSI
ncbi:hypothetical protein BST26_09075, partial [Mycolicibacterium insubricum]